MSLTQTAQIDPDTGYITNVDTIRAAHYPSLEHTTYLGHAGTTLYPKTLIEAFSADLTKNLFGNPHSASSSSQLSTQRIENVRLGVLRFFNADPDHFDVVFTANATAAIKLVAEAFREREGGFDYAYQVDSHTSLVGVREVATTSCCLSDGEDVSGWLANDTDRPDPRPRLLAYPGQSNMTGKRFSFEWSQRVNERLARGCQRVYTLLDAAALASTTPVDLSSLATAPAFTSVSFYKIFGFPDLGALLVRRDSADALFGRKYFGGGTVDGVAVLGKPWHATKDTSIPGRLEDGTLPFHSIIALDHALRIHREIYGCMQNVANHTRYLAAQLQEQLKSLRHGNGNPVCTLYGVDRLDTDPESGPVIAFNLLDKAGNYVSNAEVEKLAIVRKIDFRTGGLCNPGGTATYLGLQSDDLQQNHAMGHRCGSANDLVNGKPTGTIRVSLGAMSSRADVHALIEFLQEFFVEAAQLPLDPTEVTSPPAATGRGKFVVESLTVFPIKSCAAFNVPSDISWGVGPRGLAWDREWCLVHEGTHQALSQKTYPRMTLLRPTIDVIRRVLRVTHNIHASGWERIEVSLDEAPTTASIVSMCGAATLRKTSSVCGESVDIEHYTSPDVARFFTNAIGVPCTLARFPQSGVIRQPQIRSQTGIAPANATSGSHSIALSNESPILLVSRSSVNRLNEQIKARGKWGKTVPAESFRGNIIVSEELERGQSESPYAEDEWTRLTIGSGSEESTFQIIGPCQRCQMVCIDQRDASRRQEPFSTLAKTRKREGRVWFGMHMGLLQSHGAVVKVGDLVQAAYR